MRLRITRYGLRETAVGSAVCVALIVLGALFFWPLAVLGGALWAALLAFFRDPERPSPQRPGALLSPADGTVQDVEQVDPPGDFLPGPALRVGIFMSLLNVHVNRSPVAGTVRYRRHVPGRFHDARSPLAATENEHCWLGIELEGGRRVLVRQVAGTVARRIVCKAAPGDELAAGQRFGMVKFGSRVELFVPQQDQFQVAVAPGTKVKAGLDILGSYTS